MACPELGSVIEQFNVLTDKPVKFLAVQNELKDDIKSLVKSLYDFTKSQDKKSKKPKKGALPELIVQDLDEEQIWQEIDLQNNECWDELVREVANCMTFKNDLLFPVNLNEPGASGEQKEEDDDEATLAPEAVNDEDFTDSEAEDGDEDLAEENDDEEADNPKKKILKPKIALKPSIVDDQFFKLQEMEQFLLKEEKNEGFNKKKVSEDSDEESIDLFEDIDDDEDEEASDEEKEGGKDVMYSDFFDQDNTENYDQQNNDDDNSEDEMDEDIENAEVQDDEPPSKKDKKVRFAQPSSSDDDSDNDKEEKTENNSNEKKSEFELRQERLKDTIKRLEKKTMNEAPWQLKGEVDATKRPQNSLLEEVVDFDLTTRPAPIITEQTTLTLEDIIKQRIKDKAWDDVVKKEKPVDDQLSFRKTEILDHSKSKLSLAQVYEAEYLKQKQATSGDVEDEKEPESHKDVRESMSKLFHQLDALCHYHYTPKPAQADVKIVSNTPAISMEEVAPVSMSEAALLAPEEVKKKQRGDLMSKEERTQTDKNRERRKKKKFQKAKGPVNKVTEHRNTTKGTDVNDKSLKTSKAFFQQLNDNATSIIKNSKNKIAKTNNKKG